MLSDPKRLRTPGGFGYLVSWKHRLRTRTEAAAAAVVGRLLAEAHNVDALRAEIGRPEVTMEELAEWLVTGLASGNLNLLKTQVKLPIFDDPTETDLFDLLPPEEPKRELDSLTFVVVDANGGGLAVRYRVHAPSGDRAGSLRFIGELETDATVEVELAAMELPLRPDSEERFIDAEVVLGRSDADATSPDPEVLSPVEGPEVGGQTEVSLACEGGDIDAVQSSVPLSSEPCVVDGAFFAFSGLQLSDRQTPQ